MSKNFSGVVFITVLAFVVGTARADKYFEIFAFSNNGPNPTVVQTSNSSLTHIIGDLMNAQNTLAPIGGNGIAEISPGKPFIQLYNQVPVIIDITPASHGAFVAFGHSTNAIILNNANPTILAKEVRDAFTNDTAGDWGNEVKFLDGTNPNMPLDGNPQASTAFLATNAYNRFGGVNSLSRSALMGGDSFNVRLDVDGGLSRASALSGNYLDMSLDLTKRFDDNFALSLATALQWRTVAGASSYTFGEVLADPITVIPKTSSQTADESENYATPQDLDYGFPFDLFQSFSWQITPWGVAALAASWDEVTGSLLLGAGGTSSLSLYNGSWTFTLNDQISYMGGVGVKIADYNFNDRVNQLILKNGVDVAWQPGENGFFIDAGATFSDLFTRAAVPYYITPSLGAGLKFNANSGFRVGYTSDWGPHYQDTGAQITFWLTF